ncbi:MAG: hypothetical protein GY822_28700, partial [Deltaproteobacteria bacterium]|nr:hypothetical protein [Deltaproteobacteria bacterium]
MNLGNGALLGIQDDGPVASTVDLTFTRSSGEGSLDESQLAGTTPASGQQDGVYSATLDVSTAFTSTAPNGTVGTDLPGTTESYSLELSTQNVSSGLNLLDPLDATQAGEEILLKDNGSGGVVGYEDGNASNEIFTITVSNAGVVTFAYNDQTDPENIYHSDPSSNDEEAFLSLATGESLLVKQTITDQDNDSVTTSGGVNLGNGALLGIQDDGPVASTVDLTFTRSSGEGSLDESQ